DVFDKVRQREAVEFWSRAGGSQQFLEVCDQGVHGRAAFEAGGFQCRAAGAAVIHAMALENAGRGGVFPEDAGDGVVGAKHGASLLRLPMRLPAYSGPVETVFNRLKSLLKDKRTTRSGDLFYKSVREGEQGGGRGSGGGEAQGGPVPVRRRGAWAKRPRRAHRGGGGQAGVSAAV